MYVKAIFIFSLFLFSCNNSSNTEKAENEKVQINRFDINNSTNKEKIEKEIKTQANRLNTNLLVSNSIADFFPNIVKKHDDVSQFLSSYVQVGDKIGSHSYENLNNFDVSEEDVSDMQETNNEGKDYIKMFKKTYTSIKNLKKTAWGAFKTGWSGKDLLSLEDKRKELINKYSAKVLDSFRFVEKAIDKYYYYSYLNPYNKEMEKINSRKSIRTMPITFTKDQRKELKINTTLEKFIELQKAGNEVRKVLIFNKLVGKEYSDLIKFQLNKISTFLESDNSEYENDTKLFKSFVNKLVDLKADLKEKKDYLKNNKDDWSATSVNDLEMVIARYEDAVKNELQNLNINELPEIKWSVFKDAKQNLKTGEN